MAERIPTELIEHIFSFAARVDTPTCLSICLTNKMGQRVATPALYETVGIIPRNKTFPRDTIGQRLRSISLLCQTLLKNRSLAQLVTGIQQYCDDSELPDAMFVPEPPPPSSALLDKLVNEEMPLREDVRAQVRGILDTMFTPPTGDERETLLALRRAELEDPDANDEDFDGTPFRGSSLFLATLVLMCPRLKRIHISGDIEDGFAPASDMIHALASNHLSTPPGARLWNVDEFTIDNCLGNDVGEDIMRAMSLPGLKKLHVIEMSHTLEELLGLDPTSIEELTFSECMADSGMLAPLISACPQLKNLSIVWRADEILPNAIDFSELRDALPPSLEQLRLEFRQSSDEGPGRFEACKIFSGISSLRALQHLHTITANPFVFFGRGQEEQNSTFETVLPDAVKTVTLITEYEGFSLSNRDLLSMPGAGRLEDLIIWNWDRTRYMTKANPNGCRKRRGSTLYGRLNRH